MEIIYKEPTLKEITELMERINQNGEHDCYFKAVKGEVHVIIEEKKYTFGINDYLMELNGK